VVDDYTWTFGRGDERLQLRRQVHDDGVHFSIATSDRRRTFSFPDLDAMRTLQSDMETFLLRSGWTFLEFSPDRRTGRDRRQMPRLRERRRWWTDGRNDSPLTVSHRRRK
jgi:hypothetical protein